MTVLSWVERCWKLRDLLSADVFGDRLRTTWAVGAWRLRCHRWMDGCISELEMLFRALALAHSHQYSTPASRQSSLSARRSFVRRRKASDQPSFSDSI